MAKASMRPLTHYRKPSNITPTHTAPEKKSNKTEPQQDYEANIAAASERFATSEMSSHAMHSRARTENHCGQNMVYVANNAPSR